MYMITGVVHEFGEKKQTLPTSMLLAFLIVVSLGIFTGYFLAGNSSKTNSTDTSILSAADIKKGDTFGSNDTKTFKDSTEGLLKKGGIADEGAFHLERPGGDSQNVYLTSSSVDLSKFVGRKIKVWGQTNTGKKAGWLMDVGRLQLLN